MGSSSFVSTLKNYFKFSKVKEGITKEEEIEARVNDYEQHVSDYKPYGPLDYPDENPWHNYQWWQYLLYDMSSRVTAVIILSCAIGIVLPIIFFVSIDNGQGQLDNFGSCLVSIDHRFQFEINQIEDTLNSQENCSKVWAGCWENNNTLQFKCYHSVPSPFQYYLSSDATYIPLSTSRRFSDRQSRLGDENSLIASIVELSIKPIQNLDSSLMNYKTRISWHSADILSIQFFDPSNPPSNLDLNTADQEQQQQREGRVDGSTELKIEFPDNQNDFFYIRIGRMDTDETIYESRLGPMKIHDNTFTFGTALPSKYFYGLNGGQGVTHLGATIVDGVNAFGQNEMPFYMVRESSGKMHGVLLETMFPFVAQVIDGPGILFEFERAQDQGSIPLSLKLFVGPTPADVLSQFGRYMQEKASLPPYWGLGLHLCRQSKTANDSLAQIKELSEDPELIIPYDSDCISTELRTPFKIDTKNFPNEDLLPILNELNGENRRRLLLTQRLSQPNLTSDLVEPGNLQMFILDDEEDGPFMGMLGKNFVNYYSIFNDIAKQEIVKNFQVPKGTSVFDGVVLIDNLPRHDNASWDFEGDKAKYKNSRIQSNFSSSVWGNVGPTAKHLKPVITNNSVSLSIVVEHLELSNIYGEESLKFFSDLMTRHVASAQAVHHQRTIVSTTSMWTRSFTYGSFNGIDVPFTWEGLRASLSTALRYFMFNPFGGIPACGSYQIDEDVPFDQDLCLRWFQVSLLLPFVRSSYGISNTNSSRGPVDFNKKYQRHLINNIQNRYALNPYYYTLFNEYTMSRVPPILPLSFHFQDANSFQDTFPILDQFMIGHALLAAPLVFPGTSRLVYFPKGTWYTLDGELAWDNADRGESRYMSALINYVPLFIRGGHIIPTLLNTDALTAEASRSRNYTLIGTFPKTPADSLSSTGSLFMDDGVSLSSPEDDPGHHKLEFELFPDKFIIRTLTFPCSSNLDPTIISTKIDEIRIIGIPRKPTNIKWETSGEPLPRKSVVYDTERSVLRLQSLNIDWCGNDNETLSWDKVTL